MKRLILRFSLIIAIAPLGIIAFPVRNTAVAAGFCQCITFVANCTNVTDASITVTTGTGGASFWRR